MVGGLRVSAGVGSKGLILDNPRRTQVMDITYTLCRYNETTDEESEVELTIFGEYEGEIPDESWGYYGATPGMAEDAYITAIKVKHDFYGPFCPWKLVPRVYYTPWEGTLTPDEETAVKMALIEHARSEAEAAAEDAAVSAYEARMDMDYY